MTAERHLRQLHPTVDKEFLDQVTEGSPVDNTGSQPDRRHGSLRGCPSVTRMTFDNTKRIDDTTIKLDQHKDLYVEGYNMYTMSNLYLSASNIEMFPEMNRSEYSFFEDNYDNRIADENPSFHGISLSAWVVLNDNNIYFTIPGPKTAGTIDIVLQGPAGYSISSQFTKYMVSVMV